MILGGRCQDRSRQGVLRGLESVGAGPPGPRPSFHNRGGSSGRSAGIPDRPFGESLGPGWPRKQKITVAAIQEGPIALRPVGAQGH